MGDRRLILISVFILSAALARADQKGEIVRMSPSDAVWVMETVNKDVANGLYAPKGCSSFSAAESKPANGAQTIQELGRAIVDECSLQGAGKTIKVVSESEHLPCTARKYTSSEAKYSISSEFPTGIRIGQKFVFSDFFPKIDKYKREELIGVARACAMKFQEVFRRYDIHYDLRIKWEDEPETKYTQVDYPVKMIRISQTDDLNTDTVNTSDHHFLTDWQSLYKSCEKEVKSEDPEKVYPCVLGKKDRFCQIMLHEVAHSLGQSDEYKDPACPKRPIPQEVLTSYPVSVMGNRYVPWDDLAFFPRHIEKMIAPLCAENPTRFAKTKKKRALSYLSSVIAKTETVEQAKTSCKGLNQALDRVEANEFPEELFQSPKAFHLVSCFALNNEKVQERLAANLAKWDKDSASSLLCGMMVHEVKAESLKKAIPNYECK